jgi:hypothetical protein
MNRLNLDISQYSTNELEDIFNVKCSLGSQAINNHFDSIKTSIYGDDNFDLDQKENINTFLNKVINKLVNDDKSSFSKINETFSAPYNNLIKDVSIEHSIIKNPNTNAGLNAKIYEGRTVDSVDQPPGYINPINIRTIRKILNIDTRFRSSYYSTKSTDFHLDLPETFNRVVNLKLTALEIPLTIYGINQINNCFTVDSSNIDISAGNYSNPFFSLNYKDFSGNIADEVQSRLVSMGTDISYSINPITGKSQFESTSPHIIYFNKDCTGENDLTTPLPLKLGWLLGYRVGKYELTPGIPLISEGIVTTISPKYLYLCINDYTNAGNNNYIAAFNQSTLSPHIIARIPYLALVQNNGTFNSYQDDDIVNASREYFGPVNIQKLHLQILDEYGQIVDFNNMDWSCSLSFDIQYD